MKNWLVAIGILICSSLTVQATVIIKKIEHSEIGCVQFQTTQYDNQKPNETTVRCWDLNPLLEDKTNYNDTAKGFSENLWRDESQTISRKPLSPLPWFGNDAVDFAVSQSAICAILKNKTIACVGSHYTLSPTYGKTNAGLPFVLPISDTPISIPLGNETPTLIESTADGLFCAATKEMNVHCWDPYDVAPKVKNHGPYFALEKRKELGLAPPTTHLFSMNSPIKALTLHHDFRFCALLESGDVKCFSLFNQGWLVGFTEDTDRDKLIDQLLKSWRSEHSKLFENKSAVKIAKNLYLLSKYLAFENLVSKDENSYFFKIFKGEQKAKSVVTSHHETCISYEDGTASCWGEGPKKFKSESWFSFTIQPVDKFFSSQLDWIEHPEKNDFELKTLQRYEIKSPTQKIVKIVPYAGMSNKPDADKQGVCFILSPGSPDGTSNLKCPNYPNPNAVHDKEDWLDALPWVPTKLPVIDTIPSKRGHRRGEGICLLFINQSAKCASSIKEIIARPEIDFLSTTEDGFIDTGQ